MKSRAFRPTYRLTNAIAKALMSVEANRQVVMTLPLTVPMLDSLRRTARLLSTHFSTQIEGNRLTPAQVKAVVEGEGSFPGRERDETEVKNYFAALEYVERLGRTAGPLTEKDIRTIHGLVMTGKPKPTTYRDGQNVIRDGRSGRIVYMPPEAKDVPSLMKEMVAWVNGAIAEGDVAVSVIAALLHYQFATIHPYFDGNGRSARLLTTLLLHCAGYGLGGIYSLEEYYAKNLDGYYGGLAVGPSHNYYFGRAESDVTPFLEYFCAGMADAFMNVRSRAEEASRLQLVDQSPLLRNLTPQQRTALGIFLRTRVISSKDVAAYFKLKPRMAALLCAKWLRDGFLVIENPSTKARTYRLADPFESLIERQVTPSRQEPGEKKKRKR